MTQELKPCPFCGAHLAEPTAVQYPKMGLARLHPGSLDDGTCPIAGWGFYTEQLAAWNTRTTPLETEGERKLRRALEPFKREFEDMGSTRHLRDDQLMLDVDCGGEILTVGHWRRLMEALAALGGQQ